MGLACAAALLGQPFKAARLFGAEETLRQRLGVPVSPAVRPLYEHYVAAGRAQLDEASFAAAWAAGHAMTLEEAMRLDEEIV